MGRYAYIAWWKRRRREREKKKREEGRFEATPHCTTTARKTETKNDREKWRTEREVTTYLIKSYTAFPEVAAECLCVDVHAHMRVCESALVRRKKKEKWVFYTSPYIYWPTYNDWNHNRSTRTYTHKKRRRKIQEPTWLMGDCRARWEQKES